MGKSILMSIQPQWVAKILNGEKTIEVRKKFPKDYVGWVYIYCTKGNWKNCLGTTESGRYEYGIYEYINYPYPPVLTLNGKVVARFWCDKVEMIRFEEWVLNHNPISHYFTASLNEDDFMKKCGMYNHEEYLDNYLGKKTDNGYAIHITKLEVFDEPRLLTMFRKPAFNKTIYDINNNRLSLFERLRKYSTTKAPQSWYYIDE